MFVSSQRQLVHRAILSAYPVLDDFSSLLSEKLDVRLDRLVKMSGPEEPYEDSGPPKTSSVLSEVLVRAEQAGWLPELVKEAYEARPDNVDLADAYKNFGFASSLDFTGEASSPSFSTSTPSLSATGSGLESVVAPATGLAVTEWQRLLRNIEPKVCRVESFGMPSGTAFLVGPGLVLTAHCVVERLQAHTRIAPGDLRFRFDYKGAEQASGQGVLIEAAEDWLVDFSPADVGNPERGLDYALIRLSPGNDNGVSLYQRGWLQIPENPVPVAIGDTLVLARYPNTLSEPLSISLADKGITGTGQHIIYHTAESGPGTAGAPCFNGHFDLIGMHHAKMLGEIPPRGVAIEISAIRRLIEQKGHAGLLGGDPPSRTDSFSLR